MRRILILLLILIISSCSKDKYKVERQYQACFFEAFSENQKQAKMYIKEYEGILINEKVLKSPSQKSYFTLLEQTLTSNFLEIKSNYSLLDSLNKVALEDFTVFNFKCKEEVRNSIGYKNSIMYNIETQVNQARDNGAEPDLINEVMISLYPKDYFTLDLHKLQILLAINKVSKEITLENEIDWKNVFSIRLKGKRKIFVDEKKVSAIEMKKMVKDYLISHRSKSVFVIDFSKDLEIVHFFEVTMNIKTSVDEVREEVSREMFKKSYNELSEEGKELIETQIPYKIIDKEGASLKLNSELNEQIFTY